MRNKTNISNINKLRSYSSIFSSTSFNKLLKFDDYSFIDSKIEQYDQNMIGKTIITYYDYIRYVYNSLRKQYKNEYIYKNTIINELLIKGYGVKDSVLINEFRVSNSIADIVMFNGTSKAFEIKTELDTDKRLVNQLSDYSKIFKESYIVTHESLIDKYLKAADSQYGVISLVETSRSLKLEEIRPARIDISIDSSVLMKSLRADEYKNIVKSHFGELPIMNSFNMYDICNELMTQIPDHELNDLFIDQLKKRKTNTLQLKTYYKELRQISLSMNLNEKLYNNLYFKLNKPITI